VTKMCEVAGWTRIRPKLLVPRSVGVAIADVAAAARWVLAAAAEMERPGKLAASAPPTTANDISRLVTRRTVPVVSGCLPDIPEPDHTLAYCGEQSRGRRLSVESLPGVGFLSPVERDEAQRERGHRPAGGRHALPVETHDVQQHIRPAECVVEIDRRVRPQLDYHQVWHRPAGAEVQV